MKNHCFKKSIILKTFPNQNQVWKNFVLMSKWKSICLNLQKKIGSNLITSNLVTLNELNTFIVDQLVPCFSCQQTNNHY